MDKRQTDIVEGAGLEESRINADFKDWLAKWSGPILFAVLALALSYRGWVWWKDKQVKDLDSAYIELDAAVAAGQPAGLLQIAHDWEGKGAVAEQANLEAADRLLMAVSVGLKPGGVAGDKDDALPEDEKADDLDQAGQLYKDVYESTRENPDQTVLMMRALSGVAAVAITKGDLDAGRGALNDLITAAKANGMTGLAKATADRLDKLSAGLNPAPMLPKAEIVALQPAKTPAKDDEGFLTPEQLLKELGPQPDLAPAQSPSATPTPDKKEPQPAVEKPAPSGSGEQAPAPAGGQTPTAPPADTPAAPSTGGDEGDDGQPSSDGG